MTVDNHLAYHKPSGQKNGANIGEDPDHPYLHKYRILANESEQNRFDLAAGLQSATELRFKTLLSDILRQIPDIKNLCLAGGVALNSVMTGKIKTWFPQIENIYIPPATHDGGLTIGAAQYMWHNVLDNPRIEWKDNFTPYLGRKYSLEEVNRSIADRSDELTIIRDSSDDDVIDSLFNQEIVSVFGGGSESGKRALGNRSILADPRSPTMKDTINEKVKHRQWFRPFAPSILREEVGNWFTEDIDSPYMSFVLKFNEDKAKEVPAVVHYDGSARLQTVTSNDNDWYHRLLKKWHQKSSVPILLNTSFNDREPICETPSNALDCFLRTNIDKLYFYDYGIIVSKK
jgi:carbamoyltransferase